MDDSPFFIVGCGRSGTTLLRLILCGHSRLHVVPETWFVRDLVQQFPLTDPLSPDEVVRAVDLMVEDYRWADMGIAATDFRRRVMAFEQPRLADIIDTLYRWHLGALGKPRFADKTPNYIDIVPQLCTLYPGAKFIHLIRDGRDVAVSYLELDWGQYYDRRNFLWTRAMRCRDAYQNSAYAASILEVRYEDLMAGLEATVRTICDFLGEEFEPEMLNWQRHTHLVPEREREIHGNLARPISASSIGKWRTKLSAVECFLIESSLHEDLRRLGYDLRFGAPRWRVPLAVSGWTIAHLASPLKRTASFLKHRPGLGMLRHRLYF